MLRSSKLALVAACGAAAGLAGAAAAQPTVISISGATLLENYLNQNLATVDFIDADGNGQLRGTPLACRQTQQLAPFLLPAGFGAAAVWDPSVVWGVQYTAVGSTRGLQELIDNGRTYNTGDSGKTSGFLAGRPTPGAPALVENVCMDIDRRSSAFFNTQRYITANNLLAGNPVGNYRNAGGAPVRVRTDGTFRALFTSQDVASTAPNEGLTASGGVTVDAAILDVPVRYAVRQTGGTTSAIRKPGEPGYGDNGRLALNKDGTATTTGNKLASLTPTGGCFGTAANINTAAPDANTIYDTPLFLATVAPIANFGTGITQMNVSDLRHLYSTGRLPSGENIAAVTRDSGSGTRNAWDNTIGIDPSWGIGDNIGAVNNALANDRVGANFLPSNKNGNPRVEQTVYNHRLAIGYVGPERGLRNSSPDIQWLSSGYCDIPSVVFDLYGGTTPQRPTCTAIAQNTTGNAWFINGPASFGTFGDPRSAPASKGGYGWMEPFCDFGADGAAGTSDAGEGDGVYTVGEPYNDFNLNSVRDAVEPRPGVVPPAMRNTEAAAFINNITRSIDAFEGGFTTPTTPGQLAAQAFFLVAAAQRIQDPNNPLNMVPNPGYNASLQAFILGSGSVTCNSPLYTAFGQGVEPVFPGNSRAGKVPGRVPGTYSDSTINAAASVNGNYITESGAILDQDGDLATTGSRDNLPLRNLISGDFNGDGLRNINDVPEMIGAFLKRTTGAAWTAPSGSGALAALSVVTGQGVGGGDFSIEIVGDFTGDGSFTSADLRYFADGLALPTSGPSAGKVDRKAGFIALDNALNTATGGTDNNVFNTMLATGKTYQPGDSRGDVVDGNGRSTPGFAPIGEGMINARDIDYVYRQFKNANILDGAANWDDFAEAIFFDLSGDITGDRIVDQADVTELVNGILGTCTGDVNLDGVVNAADRTIIQASIATPPANVSWASGDLNGDGVVNAADLALYCPADINCSGGVTVQDIFDFLAFYFSGAPKADINASGGAPTVQDIFDFLAIYFAGC